MDFIIFISYCLLSFFFFWKWNVFCAQTHKSIYTNALQSIDVGKKKFTSFIFSISNNRIYYTWSCAILPMFSLINEINLNESTNQFVSMFWFDQSKQFIIKCVKNGIINDWPKIIFQFNGEIGIGTENYFQIIRC